MADPYEWRIRDLQTLDREQTEQRLTEWLGKFDNFAPQPALPSAILMLLSHKLDLTLKDLTKSSQRLESLTSKLLGATWVLVALTVVLGILTVALLCKSG